MPLSQVLCIKWPLSEWFSIIDQLGLVDSQAKGLQIVSFSSSIFLEHVNHDACMQAYKSSQRICLEYDLMAHLVHPEGFRSPLNLLIMLCIY